LSKTASLFVSVLSKFITLAGVIINDKNRNVYDFFHINLFFRMLNPKNSVFLPQILPQNFAAIAQ